jgi:hypothetical protein
MVGENVKPERARKREAERERDKQRQKHTVGYLEAADQGGAEGGERLTGQKVAERS